MPSFSFLELTNGDKAAIHANRRNHGVETRAVLETGVDVGVGFVDAAAHGGHDLVDDAQEVAFILEPHIRQFQATRAFHEDAVGAVHQNIVDRVVLQKRLKRAKARHLVEQLDVQHLAVFAVQDHAHLRHLLAGDGVDFRAQLAFLRRLKRRKVQVVQKTVVHVRLEFIETLAALGLLLVAAGRRWSPWERPKAPAPCVRLGRFTGAPAVSVDAGALGSGLGCGAEASGLASGLRYFENIAVLRLIWLRLRLWPSLDAGLGPA
jgi:hypothetical protein